MARPSKPHRFAIHQDDINANIPTANEAHPSDPPYNMRADSFESTNSNVHGNKGEDEDWIENNSQDEDCYDHHNDTQIKAQQDAWRRYSNTRTSISSLPESNTDTDYDTPAYMYKPSFTSPTIRPAFRRPDSVRRMQMSSPTPFERSPRRSVLHQSRSRPGTPRSLRPESRGSPRTPKHDVLTEKDYPLILLHITLLPLEMRWSAEVLETLLTPATLENIRLLKSKISETILHRGILISHPREEYEMLEERLLEALELKNERVTKCGHFRARDSTSSTTSSLHSADSGIGASGDDLDGETCHTCSSPIKLSKAGVPGKGNQKWSVKVFAANGLMRASAWSAAWSEMERVDVEIMPWISEDLRRSLDEAQQAYEADEAARAEEKQARVKAIVEEQVALAHESKLKERHSHEDAPAQEVKQPDATVAVASKPEHKEQPSQSSQALPVVYPAKDIPVSMLLKNYIFLLARDRRNAVIFILLIIAAWSSVQVFTLPKAAADVSPVPSVPSSRIALYSTAVATNVPSDMHAHVAKGHVKDGWAREDESLIAAYYESDVHSCGLVDPAIFYEQCPAKVL